MTIKNTPYGLIGALLITGFVASCSPKKTGPSALQYTIHERYLAPVELSPKQPLFEAYKAVYVAKSELDHAEFTLQDIELEIGIASRDIERSKLAGANAKQLRGSAGVTRQKSRDGIAKRAESGAAAEADESKRRLTYLKLEKEHRKAKVEYSRWAIAEAAAAFERAKAELAQSEGIEPVGFKIDKFRTQDKKRKNEASVHYKRLMTKKSAATKSRIAWQKSAGIATKETVIRLEASKPTNTAPVKPAIQPATSVKKEVTPPVLDTVSGE